MKNVLQTYTARYPKKGTTLIKVSFVIVFMSFIVYDKASLQPDDNNPTNEQGEQSYISSISIVNGHYKIDSNVVDANKNKALLVADLKTENIIRKTTVEEIPGFILAFFESISNNKKFDIANPWDEWRSGDIMDLVLPDVDANKENKNFTRLLNTQRELPDKKLVYFGIGDSIALLSYYSGGIRMQQHIVIIKFKNEKLVDLWFGEYLGLSVNTKVEILQCLDQRGNGSGC